MHGRKNIELQIINIQEIFFFRVRFWITFQQTLQLAFSCLVCNHFEFLCASHAEHRASRTERTLVDVPHEQMIQRFQHSQQKESVRAKELSNLDSSATWLLCFFANPFKHKEKISNGLNLPFREPRIVIYSYNEIQRDAPFL